MTKIKCKGNAHLTLKCNRCGWECPHITIWGEAWEEGTMKAFSWLLDKKKVTEEDRNKFGEEMGI